MIPLVPDNLPARKDPFVDADGTPTTDFYFLIRTLFLRTGSVGGVPWTVGANLTASGAAQATALGLVDDFNEVLAGSGGGGQLAELQAGQTQVVFNGSGGGINVYPPVGSKIDALALNAAYALANNKTQVFTCYSVSAAGLRQFRSLQLG